MPLTRRSLLQGVAALPLLLLAPKEEPQPVLSLPEGGFPGIVDDNAWWLEEPPTTARTLLWHDGDGRWTRIENGEIVEISNEEARDMMRSG